MKCAGMSLIAALATGAGRQNPRDRITPQRRRANQDRRGRYETRLDNSLREAGLRADLRIMASNGGVATPAMVSERPVMTRLSGLAAGVLGGAWVGESLSTRCSIAAIYCPSASASRAPRSCCKRTARPSFRLTGRRSTIPPAICRSRLRGTCDGDFRRLQPARRSHHGRGRSGRAGKACGPRSS